MTGFTHTWRGWHVLNIHTRSIRTVMTFGTHGNRCGRVVKRRHHPIHRAVANFTGFAGGNVVNAFTGGNHPIVTRTTTAQYLSVIHLGGRHPHLRNMTGIALLGSGNMCCAPTAGNHAIMTNGTGLGGCGVVKTSHCPVVYYVAGITGQCSG